ncbi:MAG: MSMEG_1061 family FMN-dependent PPOX-type flavoprotein [Pseudomonadota bacterium]
MTDPNLISDPEALRADVGEPTQLVLDAIRPKLDTYSRRFIELSPFMCIASADAKGAPTVSPRGDGPGFVTVLDDTHIVFPDHFGNRKVQSLSNIVENPQVGLIFFIPGIRESLRVHGTAVITKDEDMRALGTTGRSIVPKRATIVEIDTVTFHCGKTIIRSGIWDQSTHLDAKDFPTLFEVLKHQQKLDTPQDEGDAFIETVVYKDELY